MHDYYSRMFQYYDGAKYNFDYDSLRAEARSSDFGVFAPILDEAKKQLAGLRVLDVGCGIGKWCRGLAPTVQSIVGCDVSQKLLDIAAEATPATNVSYVCDDAMSLSKITGDFDADFHFNFFNHLPRKDWLRFIDTLHARLGSGKRAIMGAQKLSAERRRQILTWIDDVDDPVQSNPRGQTNYFIVENTFDESLVRLVMQTRALKLEYREASAPNGQVIAWYATYRVA